jgi:hypothetical protein
MELTIINFISDNFPSFLIAGNPVKIDTNAFRKSLRETKIVVFFAPILKSFLKP